MTIKEITTLESLNLDSHLPYYVQIKYYLRNLIASLPPNSPIPSENELSEKFKVSRGTAKQAIQDLVYEGLLYRKQGRGTFTSSRISRSYNVMPSYTKDIENSGHVASSKLLSFKKNAIAPRATAFFGLPQDSPVICYKRLVKDDELPIAVVFSYLNPTLFPELSEEDIGTSLYQSLEKKYHLIPEASHDSYSVAHISESTASLLNRPLSDIVIYSERKAYTTNMIPMEFVESYIRSDRFLLEIDYKQTPANTTVPEVSVNYSAM